MTGILDSLRSLVPKRALTINESFRLAELQAIKLLAALGVAAPPVPEQMLARLPQVEIMRIAPLPVSVSGGAKWVKGLWLIVVNAAEPPVRQRFSLAHEIKHVLDGKHASKLYPAIGTMSSHERTEQVCDVFAANLLMPKTWVRKAYANGPQDLRSLAKAFGVSMSAMNIRLQTLGLTPAPARCEIIERVA